MLVSKRIIQAMRALVLLLVSFLTANVGLSLRHLVFYSEAPIPFNMSVPTERPLPITPGDLYVATDGSDAADGSFDAPFASIARARDEIRARKQADGLPEGGLTVCVKGGEYSIRSLQFDARDSGTADSPIRYRAYGDAPVILNGGITLGNDDFRPVSPPAKERLAYAARGKVVEIDLVTCGLTAADWGKLYAVGAFNTANKYDGDTEGPPACELFFNDDRMTLARWPNGDGYLKTGEILDLGDFAEYPPKNYNPDWGTLRNPRGGTFRVDWHTNQRMKNWQTLDDVWLFGYFYWDWADASTPIKAADTKNSTLTTAYANSSGFKEDAPYFIYNAFEELDTPGEWYLDRSTGMLYLYPPGDVSTASVTLSVSTESLLDLRGADYLHFTGFELKGSRGNAVTLYGRGNRVEDCLLTNCAESGMDINGYDNVAFANEIKCMGKAGILIDGGDRTTLTPGNNRAENNHIHHYGEIYKTYWGGVRVLGTGNVCAHNEIHDAPHIAIHYSGNDHLLEYNRIYDVVKLSGDAGAIYAGGDFTAYGNVLRYNCIYNIGSGDFRPDGIYFDDAMSGQTAYGNVLVNVPKAGFMLGGGRNLRVYNNLIINADTAIRYDERAREGVLSGGWFSANLGDENGGMLKYLLDSPYRTPLWAERYPHLALVHADFDNADDPYFAANPAGSVVKNNIIVDRSNDVGRIADSVYRYSTVENNPSCLILSNPGFVNFRGGDYRLRDDARVLEQLDGFEPIPFEEIGRY